MPQRNHAVAFTPSGDGDSLATQPTSITTGRVLTRDAEFAGDILDLAISYDWLLALRLNNHLTGLNLRDGTLRDFSGVLGDQKHDERYAFLWRGQREGEIYIGNINQTFARLTVTSKGMPTGILPLVRPVGFAYSLPVAGEEWLSNGYFRDAPVTLVVGSRLVGDQLTEGHRIEKPVFPGLPPLVSYEVNRNSVVARPDGGRLAQAFWYAPIIYIYDRIGTPLKPIVAPIGINQVFGEQLIDGEARMLPLPETVGCYINVAASDTRVIGLFSGKKLGDAKANYEGSELHIFDWNAHLIEVVHLDFPASRLAVSSDSKLLWAVRHGPNPAIVEYKLP